MRQETGDRRQETGDLCNYTYIGLSRNKRKNRTLRHKGLFDSLALLSCADGFHRTAYPRFSRVFTSGELQDVYTPTPEEVLYARLHIRDNAGLLSFLVLLKCFQRLQYFPPLPDVPAPVVDHVRTCLHLPPDLPLGCDQPKTLYRYHAAIREHLNVKVYKGKAARHTAV